MDPPAIALSPVFTPEVQRWGPDIVRWADAAGVSADLAATVMQIESCGHPSVRSPAGAAGLFQVMPFHFAAGENALEVETNARRGLSYLARAYVLSAGRADQTLAGYNGGHGVIERDPSAWPAETQRYVYWGTGILEDIQAGRTVSPRLEAWLQAGGASLCRRAAASG
jgi:soluble lytic murein transglycosylase-like protein